MAKSFGKSLKQDISLWFLFEKPELSKAIVKQMTKAALALELGKFIFVCKIFRMDTQLHTQTNPERFDTIFYPCIYPEFIDSHSTFFLT